MGSERESRRTGDPSHWNQLLPRRLLEKGLASRWSSLSSVVTALSRGGTLASTRGGRLSKIGKTNFCACSSSGWPVNRIADRPSTCQSAHVSRRLSAVDRPSTQQVGQEACSSPGRRLRICASKASVRARLPYSCHRYYQGPPRGTSARLSIVNVVAPLGELVEASTWKQSCFSSC